jgi:hypothetical protein
MDASTRLYARLGEIPEDPNDPESLDDLIVCAFGAFERYYLCWKTKSGEFRQGWCNIDEEAHALAHTSQTAMIYHQHWMSGSARLMAQHETGHHYR